ncbi:MAG: hypothetical protein EOP73_15175 [Variovorax sp.]|nr:MAG: hypothetical protein EOP73_15175 [Variovorax sp.]
MPSQVILIHPDAPPKPAEGRPCNGCGVCCASEPCPAGVLASGRRRGACAALVWSPTEARYRCGLISEPAAWLPRPLRGAAPVLAPLLSRLARRFVAAGRGCDSSVSVERGPSGG